MINPVFVGNKSHNQKEDPLYQGWGSGSDLPRLTTYPPKNTICFFGGLLMEGGGKVIECLNDVDIFYRNQNCFPT
jgi:hypothetical protein